MKKISILLAAVAVVALSGAAYAGTVGHVGVGTIDDINISQVQTITSATLSDLNADHHHDTTTGGVTAHTMAEQEVRDELGSHFPHNDEIHVLTLPALKYSTLITGGVAALHIVNLHQEPIFDAGEVYFFLRDGGGNQAIKFEYAGDNPTTNPIGLGQYAFVNDGNTQRSKKPTADNKNLLFHLAASGNHLHSVGSSAISTLAAGNDTVLPLFATGKDHASGGGGGGGCDAGAAAPFALLIFAGAGAALKFFKKSGD